MLKKDHKKFEMSTTSPDTRGAFKKLALKKASPFVEDRF